MNILSIETSCDETAVSLVSAEGGINHPKFVVKGNALFTQIKLHTEFGGVFPMLAKREHAKNLPHIILETLTQAGEITLRTKPHSDEKWTKIMEILAKENGLYDGLRAALEGLDKPNIDIIAVTAGPGLEPALWTGISCAVALGVLWDVPVVPANHMEGHILSVLIENSDERPVAFPTLALLISGGHTELVDVQSFGEYTIIGETRDDAVGEAFDKVARMLGLPYPGGPQISKLAEQARAENLPHIAKLPRPMIHSGDLDFSFSGLKTSVLYYIRDHGLLTEDDKKDIAREFEDAVIDVLMEKTKQAILTTGAQTLIIAGGVIANKKLRETCIQLENEYTGLIVKTPTQILATDNALMIACASYIQILLHPELLQSTEKIIAWGNKSPSWK